MGQQAVCTLTYRGKTFEGMALLETTELIFRGPERLAIPLKEITTATVERGRLRIAFGTRAADFDIGPAAHKWAERITHPRSRVDKLGIKPGMAVFFAFVRDGALADEVRSRGGRIVAKLPDGGADVIFLGAERREDLQRLPETARALKPDGALWVIRPKGSEAITEAETMAAGKRAGLVDVKVVSFSETHTAEKFVVPRSRRP